MRSLWKLSPQELPQEKLAYLDTIIDLFKLITVLAISQDSFFPLRTVKHRKLHRFSHLLLSIRRGDSDHIVAIKRGLTSNTALIPYKHFSHLRIAKFAFCTLHHFHCVVDYIEFSCQSKYF